MATARGRGRVLGGPTRSPRTRYLAGARDREGLTPRSITQPLSSERPKRCRVPSDPSGAGLRAAERLGGGVVRGGAPSTQSRPTRAQPLSSGIGLVTPATVHHGQRSRPTPPGEPSSTRPTPPRPSGSSAARPRRHRYRWRRGSTSPTTRRLLTKFEHRLSHST